VLAANGEVALDRIEREQELRERDRRLRERAATLERLDEVNERIREITHELVGTQTREEIETILCEGLTSAERFDLAWVGTTNSRREGVEVRAWAGAEHGYLDVISLRPETSAEPSVQAAESHELVIESGIATGLRDEQWRREALNRGYQAVLAVPIEHGNLPYGILGVYADSKDAFDEETRDVFRELGTTVAHAMRTVEQRHALVADKSVELEFTVEDGSTTIFGCSRALDGELVVDRVLPQSGSAYVAYGSVEDTTAERFRQVMADVNGIDRARVVSEDGSTLQVELRVSGPSVATAIADHGGRFERLDAADGGGQVRMSVPAGTAVSEFIDAFVNRYPNAELTARRERPGDEAVPDRSEDALTDRQHEVLKAAFHSGFFEWPRDSSGEDVAETLGISPPTFQEHLRRAERKLAARYVRANDEVPAND
jgi:predicted DNA binding protein